MKHVPMRTCVGCRQVMPKRQLIRIVRTPENEIIVDTQGKKSGRGVYICPSSECLDRALKTRQIERSLKCTIDEQVIDSLREAMYG